MVYARRRWAGIGVTVGLVLLFALPGFAATGPLHTSTAPRAVPSQDVRAAPQTSSGPISNPTVVASDVLRTLAEPVDRWELPGLALGPQLAPPWAKTSGHDSAGGVATAMDGPQGSASTDYTLNFSTEGTDCEIQFDGTDYVNGDELTDVAGGNHSLFAPACSGETFSQWFSTAGNLSDPISTSSTVTVTSSGNISAYYTGPAPTYTVYFTTSPDTCTIEFNGTTYANGQDAVAVPDGTYPLIANSCAGQSFSVWTSSPQYIIANPDTPSTTLSVTGTVDVEATYTPGPAPYTEAQWSQLNASEHPSARTGAAMAYDPALGAVVLFGGRSADGDQGDTWTFSGGVWTNITGQLSQSPPSRYDALMAFDGADGLLILVGGYTVDSPSVFTNVTWEFNGTAWSSGPDVPTSLLPSWWSFGPDLAYDNGTGQMILTSGMEPAPGSFVFAFQGGTWTQLPITDPCDATDPLAYDSADGYLLSVGGNDSYSTCIYNGTGNFREVSRTSGLPPYGGWAQVVYDDAADAVVFPLDTVWPVNCTLPSSCSQTWAYAGGVWTNLTSLSVSRPSIRTAPGLAYDAAAGYVVYFGGGTDSDLYGDTWTLTVSSTATPLTATISATPQSGSVPLSVIFQGSATGGSAPYQFNWSFGDGSSGTGPSSAHTYTTLGIYIATLTVTDSHGATASQSVPITVTAPNGTLAVGVVVEPNSVILGEETAFDATASGGVPPYVYTWTGLPPGCTTSNVSSLLCTPTATGLYNVTVQVMDSAGHFANATTLLLVKSSGNFLTAESASPSTVDVGMAVTFTAAISGGVTPYLNVTFYFGDGTAPTVVVPSLGETQVSVAHTYESVGVYYDTEVVVDSAFAAAASSALPITVDSAPTVTVTASPADATVGEPISLEAAAAGGPGDYTTYTWDLAGTAPPIVSTSADQSWTPTQASPAGGYNVTVRVNDTNGGSAEGFVIVTVNAAAPTPLVVNVSADPLSGAPPLLVHFYSGVSGGSGLMETRFKWSFGEASLSPLENTTHDFLTVGNYTVELTVTDLVGGQQVVRWLNITVGVATSTPKSSPLGLSATDTDALAGGVVVLAGLAAVGLLMRRRRSAPPQGPFEDRGTGAALSPHEDYVRAAQAQPSAPKVADPVTERQPPPDPLGDLL